MTNTTILCSIIIPYYNVPSEHVDKCLNSILNQNWGGTRYEVIFVNDGSPLPISNSTKELFSKFHNFTYLEQENGGPGCARNSGISIAKGNYLLFVDPDDYWIENKFHKLLPYLKDSKYDIIKFSTINFNPNKNIQFDEVSTGIEFMSKQTIIKGVWIYCFLTSFIKENNILMPNIKNSEDTIFLFYSFYYAKTYIQTNIDLYYYNLCRNNSLTKQSNSVDWEIRLNYTFEGIKEISNFHKSERHKNLPNLNIKALNRAYYTIIIDHIYHIFNAPFSKSKRKAHLRALTEQTALPLPNIRHSLKYKLFRICSFNYYTMLILCKSISIAYKILDKRY